MNSENLWLDIYKMQGCGTLKVEELANLLDGLLTKIESLEERVSDLKGEVESLSGNKPYWESSSYC